MPSRNGCARHDPLWAGSIGESAAFASAGVLLDAYWIANVSGMTSGILIMTVGLAGLGLWLRSEQPVALEPTKPLAAS